jgi:hypothetical protein
MGVDRRSFLGISAAAASSAAGRAVPVGESLYENVRLGLRMAKPDGWHWITRWHYELAKDEFKVPGGESAKEYLLELAGRPLVAMTSEPPSFADACPTIVVWAQAAPESDEREAVGAHRYTYGVLYCSSLKDLSF